MELFGGDFNFIEPDDTELRCDTFWQSFLTLIMVMCEKLEEDYRLLRVLIFQVAIYQRNLDRVSLQCHGKPAWIFGCICCDLYKHISRVWSM